MSEPTRGDADNLVEGPLPQLSAEYLNYRARALW